MAEFQAALAVWLQACLADQATEGVVAVDGKTAKQGLDDNGDPLHLLNVFVHDLQAVVGQWSTVNNVNSIPQIGVRPVQANYYQPNSGHSSTVQTLLMDGSVRGVSTVPVATWSIAVVPDDGNPMPSNW